MASATGLIETLTTNLGVPHERVAAYADVLKTAGLFASDGFLLVDDAAHLLLAVMSGTAPEDAVEAVKAFDSLERDLAIVTDSSFQTVRPVPEGDPFYELIPWTLGGMVRDGIVQSTTLDPGPLQSVVHEFAIHGGPGTRRGNLTLDGPMRLMLSFGVRHTVERPDDAPPCRLDWSAQVPGRIFYLLYRTLYPNGRSPVPFVSLEEMEVLQ